MFIATISGRKFFPFYFCVKVLYLLSKNKTSFSHVENQTQQGEEETVFSADEIRQFFEDYHKRKQHSMKHIREQLIGFL